jgi:CheY-like chemotaxis protein
MSVNGHARPMPAAEPVDFRAGSQRDLQAPSADRGQTMNPAAQPACVLVVEDEAYVSSMLELVLQHLGYRVLLAECLSDGIELARTASIDTAILDINLAGVESFPIAAELRHRGIPFMFSSGYTAKNIPDAYRGESVLQKPYGQPQLQEALASLLGANPARAASQAG